jgi:thiol peroxidase
VLIKEMRLLARSIFIINKANVIRYVEYVKDSSHPPDYDKAIAALKEVLAK